jgi:4-hydroxy-tetrahydrodipicolinate synthase
VPSRTGVNLEPESVVEIVRGAHNEILVKEANPSYAHILKLFQNLRENGLEKEVKVLSGNDDMGYGILQLGGEGMVSVTSNVYPQEVEKLIRQTREGQTEARATFFELLPNMQECFEKTNPISVKQVMANKGLIRKSKVRLPLE